jgi:hypothetical protein
MAMKDAYSIVLTQSTALALFGREDAVGRMVRFDNEHDLKVTGILKDLPVNSSFSFTFLVPFSYLDQTNAGIREARTGSFGSNGYQIFVKLRPGADYGKVYPKVRNIEHTEDTAGFLEYVRMFTVIGVLVLLIACINFINLTTARSEKRAREVGVRYRLLML